MKQIIQLIEKPNAIALEQVLKSSRLRENLTVLNDSTIEVTLETAEIDFFNQLICEYCLFLLMDQYLKVQGQFIDLSTTYYEELLEEIVQDSSLKKAVLKELELLLSEQTTSEVKVIKLAPFRNFQLKDIYCGDLDEWFIYRDQQTFNEEESFEQIESTELPLQSQEEFHQALQAYYAEINFESELKAFQTLCLEVGQETVYLENLNGDVFSLQSILNYVGIGVTVNEEEISQTENPAFMRLLVLTKSIISILDVRLLEIYRKDEAFYLALCEEVSNLNLNLDVKWRD